MREGAAVDVVGGVRDGVGKGEGDIAGIRDGADVILCGCGYVGPAFSLIGYTEVGNTGVPIVDGTSVALKLAEAMAGLQKTIGLKKSTSDVSIYAPPPSKALATIRKKFGFS